MGSDGAGTLPEPPPHPDSGDGPHHWFEPLADHLGDAYLRYSFTKGTAQEVDALVEWLQLRPTDRILDVGCGPGRHAHELGRRGYAVVGVDISQRFIDLARQDAPPGVRFERLDARTMAFDREFDAVVSLCQGAFGLGGGPAAVGAPDSRDPDGTILGAMARALRPGGRLCFSAFSAYFQVRFLEATDDFDVAAGVNRERTSIRDPLGAEQECDLWTSCFTPRELRLMTTAAGLEVEHLWSVEPGRYHATAPVLELPEFVVVARLPA